MVHIVGGHMAVPTGRLSAKATNVNINVNEKTFINGGTGLFGSGFGVQGYGMPNTYAMQNFYGMPNDCCGNHNHSWNFGDYLLGTMSAGAGFLQGFLGGKKEVKADEPTPQGNNKAFEEAMKNI